MKIKYLILIMLIFLSFKNIAQEKKSNNLYVELLKNGNLKMTARTTYGVISKKKYKIKFPKFNNQFDSFIANDIKTSIEDYTCEEKGFFEIEYKVVHLTPNFVSIIKSIKIECTESPGPDIYDDTYNIMLYKNNLYKISLISTKQLTNFLTHKINKECIDNYDIVELYDFCIKASKFYVNNPINERECFSQINFNPSQSLFEFKLVKR